MKTPITEAIEKIKQSGWLDTQSKMAAVGILTELLPKEKEAIDNNAINFAKWMHESTVYVGLGNYRVMNDETHYNINQILEIFNETFTQK